jgi:hypothetical protein
MTSQITRRAAIVNSVRRGEVINILRESADPGAHAIGYASQASLTPVSTENWDGSNFDNTKWEIGAYGSWSVDHWEAEDVGVWGVLLLPIGGWSVGYRPTKARVGLDPDPVAGAMLVLNFGAVQPYIEMTYHSLDEYIIDPAWYDNGDITRLTVIGSATYFEVTSIEFLV